MAQLMQNTPIRQSTAADSKDFQRTPPERVIFSPLRINPRILWAPKRLNLGKKLSIDQIEDLRCHMFDN
jgi:hypothetical protein